MGDLKPKVLLVEDSKSLRNFISQQLTLIGCNVTSTESVAETQDVLAKDMEFSCAVLDYCLPDGEHGEVIDLVLEKKLKVVIMTSYFTPESREHFLSKGALEYIIKDSMSSVSYLIPFVKRLINNVNHHALVVDDSISMRTHIRMMLNNQYIKTTEAVDGQDALDKLAKNPDISFMITDNAMPNKNGVEMIREVRQIYDQNTLAI